MSANRFSEHGYNELIKVGVAPATAEMIAIAALDLAKGRTPTPEGQKAYDDFIQQFQLQVNEELLQLQQKGPIDLLLTLCRQLFQRR